MIKKLNRMAQYDDMPRPLQKGKYLFIYSLIALPVLGFCVFYIGVNINGILLAFQQPVYVGGKETFYWTTRQFELVYNAFFGNATGSTLKLALSNTMKYFCLNVFIMLPICFTLSYYFSKKIAGYGFFRVAIYLPSIISSVAIVVMFKSLIAADGPIATLLMEHFDYRLPALFANEKTATPTILFYCFWTGLSSNVLLLQGTFNRVPIEVTDAGRLDGVNAFQEMTKIYFPMIRGTIGTIIVLQFTGMFGSSGPILVMTGGQFGTTTLNYWIYDMVKIQGLYNLPAAMGLVMTMIGIPIVVVIRKIVLPKEDVQY